jgi:hypothetical protein
MGLEILEQTLMQLFYRPLLALVPAAEVGGASQAFPQNPVAESLYLQFLTQR